MLTHFSLFSGIGGIDLAAEWAGFITVGQCEWADYPTKVLEKHWPDVPRWRDVKDVTRESIRDRGIIGEITILSGGFPCQDVSAAAGADGAGFINEDGTPTRSGLWFQMLRVITQVQPVWVLAENVAGLLSHDEGRTFATVIKGLENANYKAVPILSPASNYGASFEGKRVFIAAASDSFGNGGCATQKCRELIRMLVKGEPERCAVWGETERRIVRALRHQEALADDLRVDYGLPDWVDRVKCLGNTVVPQQVYPILQAIADIEADDIGTIDENNIAIPLVW